MEVKFTTGGASAWSRWIPVTTTGGATLLAARFTNAPASDGTYGIGETIQAQVTWSRPVTVSNGGDDANVSLRLDLGADDNDLTNSQRKMAYVSGSGTNTLTFEYTVRPGTADIDADGVWLQTLSDSDNTVVFLENGATLTGGNPATNNALRTRAGLPTTGDTARKVDGATTATADAGADQEVETGATVTLMGSGSSTTVNPTFTYAWTQTSGTTVTLSDATAQSPTFTAPSLTADPNLEFSLTVHDGNNPSVPDTVAVRVRPPLNPTTAPCAHPSGGGPFNVPDGDVERTGLTDTGFSFRYKLAGATADLYLCQPDGTRELRATGVNSTHVETVSGLSSATRYWVAVKFTTGAISAWSRWIPVTTTGGATLLAARFTNAPASDGTYGIGETIQAQVTWSQNVTVDTGGSNRNVYVILDLGTDDNDLTNSQRRMAYVSGSGSDTLTFEYTDQIGAADIDPDGVWLQTLSGDTVVFVENGATLTGGNPATNNALRTRAGLPTTGDAGRKVDGATTATADAGARPGSADRRDGDPLRQRVVDAGISPPGGCRPSPSRPGRPDGRWDRAA